MRHLRALVAVSLLSFPSIAHAQPVRDPLVWAEQFKKAALKTDTEAMLDVIKTAGDPRLNLDGIRCILQSVKSLIGSKNAEYAEESDEKNAGTFFKRINIAVKYPGTIIFYSMVLDRDDDGWQIIQLNVDGNLNKILDAPWPA